MKALILLATFNGENFLKEQLLSISKQKFKDWFLLASDDGSNDSTREILNEFKIKHGSRVGIINGPNKGFVRNFFNLIENADEDYDLYLFCDQDDIWLDSKISHIKDMLQKTIKHNDNPSKAVAYFSNTFLINNDGEQIGITKKDFVPSFENSLIESAGGGNTMALNLAAFQSIKASIKKIRQSNIMSHDWLIYQVISGIGGNVIFDTRSTVMYRQHDVNEKGSNVPISGKISRLIRILDGEFSRMLDMQCEELLKISKIQEYNKQILERFIEIRKGKSIVKYIFFVMKNNIKRSKFFENITFYIAILLRKA